MDTAKMSNELANRLEESKYQGHTDHALLDEAIAALRSEPVAWTAHGIKREDTCVWVQDSDGPWNTSCGKVFEFTNDGPAENEANFCYHCGGALLPEPYSDAAPSRETAKPTVSENGEAELSYDNLKSIEFASSGYCPACSGWEVTKGRGCEPKVHTKTCWLDAYLSRRQG